MELSVVIADDESLARHRVVRLLQAIGGVHVAASCEDGASALAAIEPGIDAVFLDVDMPGLTGPDVAGLLGPDGPFVVFLTAHPEHAVEAFAQGAVDYLLKPVDAERLRRTVERLRARIGARSPTEDAGPPPPPGHGGRIALPTAAGAVLVELARISHVTIDGASVVVHTDERRHHTDLRLADLERRIGPGFLRVHRQALVNLARLERLERVDSGGYLAHLQGGAVVAVSRAAARALRREWGLPR